MAQIPRPSYIEKLNYFVKFKNEFLEVVSKLEISDDI
jgi:hypothetical protein